MNSETFIILGQLESAVLNEFRKSEMSPIQKTLCLLPEDLHEAKGQNRDPKIGLICELIGINLKLTLNNPNNVGNIVPNNW
jgi:hypothetical protein